MSYIGVSLENKVSPNFVKEDFTAGGSSADFTLINEVQGANPENIMVVLNNVLQEPTVAYSVVADASGNAKVLRFTETPPSGDDIYVVHRNHSQIVRTPPTNSVGLTQLQSALQTFTNDTFTGNGSTTAFTTSKSMPSSTGVLVFVDGILQKTGTHYNTSGTTLTFTSAPDTSAEIEVRHLTFASANVKIADNSVTTATIQDNAITSAKIAPGAVVADIADSSIVTAKLADNAITTAKITDANVTAAKLANVNFAGNTLTDTSNTGSITLDFATNQNFVLTLTGNVTLANPTTEAVGQSGFIVFIQDGSGSRTVSLGTDYETVGGTGLTLSTAASTTDIVPYIVVASSRILLGTPQLAFS
tara:strand:+ start:12582 stop:13661 length:1080 start_codon:yes stop_codon:yes gene_type:complete